MSAEPTMSLAEFIEGCRADSNLFWRLPSGDHQNLLEEAVDRIAELGAFVNSLDIECMHPDMGGEHQCTIRASGRKLTIEQWNIVMDCREGVAS
jgi:hypothetical protein